MPRVLQFTPALEALIRRQHGVVSVAQLTLHGLASGAAHKRVARGVWQRLLPGVFLTRGGQPSRLQLLMAAWLWAGEDALIDGPDACTWHGIIPARPLWSPVHVVTRWNATPRTTKFVRVRRAIVDVPLGGRGDVPYVDAATALVVAARAARSSREAIGVLSRGLQLGKVDVAALATAREQIGDKWCRGVDSALVAVGVGLRSPAEREMRDLWLTSRILPEPKWNQWVDLGDGGSLLCLDALVEEARLVNEVEGKRYHAWGQQFDDMHARHERLTAAGLVTLHPTPVRIRRDGPRLLERLEQTHLRNRGRGMPPGVKLVLQPPIAQ